MVSYGDNGVIRRLSRMVFRTRTSGIAGSTVTLDRDAVGIDTLRKNGTALVLTTDYTFTAPRTVTLVVAAVTTDVFIITLKTDVEDADITTANSRGSGMTDSRLSNLYTVPFAQVASAYPQAVVTAAEHYAAWYVCTELYMGERANVIELGMTYYKLAEDLLAPYIQNLQTITNADGTQAARKGVLRSTTEGEVDVFSLEDPVRWGRLWAATRNDGRQDSTASGTRESGGGSYG